MAMTIGSYIGSYRLLSLVMTGQSSQVWEVMHDARQQRYALKAMLEDHRRNREQIAYLKNEYAVGKTLDHTRVLKYVELGSHRGDLFLIMELFKAPNLKNLLLREPDRLAQNIQPLIDQSAEGLAYLHRQGWLHRDVKPDNFLYSAEGQVKLIDFALAQRPKGALARLFARKSEIQGTRSYMSPEQIRGRPLSARSDMYSFGCMLYELVSGKPPYTGSNTNELLNKHLRAAVPSLEAANRNVTPQFGGLVRSMLAKDPDSRPESLDQFLTEFRSAKVFKVPPVATAARPAGEKS